MSQEFDGDPTDRELAEQIDRAMDDWEWLQQQRASLTKVHALPAEERARAAAEGAAASEALQSVTHLLGEYIINHTTSYAQWIETMCSTPE